MKTAAAPRARPSPRTTVLVLAGVLAAASALALAAVVLLSGAASGRAESARAARHHTAAAGGDGAAAPVPYVRLATGACFDHPGLSREITRTERRSCAGPHDGEVVAERRLEGRFRSEQALRQAALSLCADAAERRLERVPQDGRAYRPYAVHPSLRTYEQHRETAVACALTLGGQREGAELTTPLP